MLCLILKRKKDKVDRLMDKDVKINLSIKDIRRSRLTKWVTVVLVFLLVNIALVSFTGQSLFCLLYTSDAADE